MTYQVEHRNTFWFIVDRDAGLELAPVFDYEVTCREICLKVNAGYAFFQSIPTVPVDSPYPRNNISLPRPYPRKVEL